jgi:hypothetical protein
MNIMNVLSIVNPGKSPSRMAGARGYFGGLTIQTTFMTFIDIHDIHARQEAWP